MKHRYIFIHPPYVPLRFPGRDGVDCPNFVLDSAGLDCIPELLEDKDFTPIDVLRIYRKHRSVGVEDWRHYEEVPRGFFEDYDNYTRDPGYYVYTPNPGVDVPIIDWLDKNTAKLITRTCRFVCAIRQYEPIPRYIVKNFGWGSALEDKDAPKYYFCNAESPLEAAHKFDRYLHRYCPDYKEVTRSDFERRRIGYLVFETGDKLPFTSRTDLQSEFHVEAIIRSSRLVAALQPASDGDDP